MEKKEAMKILKDFHDKSALFLVRTALDTIIPELKEGKDSEDERIRKTLIHIVKGACDKYSIKYQGKEIGEEKLLAWLEKQGEKTFDKIVEKARTEKQRVLLTETDGSANIDWDCRSLDDVKILLKCGLEFIRTIEANKQILTDNRFGGCSLRVLTRYDKGIKQGEQKPAEYTLKQAASIFLDALSNTPYNNKPITDAQVITKELLKFLEDTSSYNPNAINEQKTTEWTHKDGKNLAELWEILSVHRNTNPQVDNLMEWVKGLVSYKRQKWSEEDEKMFIRCVKTMKGAYYLDGEALYWLENRFKSLRPQNTWKPSDEQIGVIEAVINNRSFQRRHLDSLYEQLKKLREE